MDRSTIESAKHAEKRGPPDVHQRAPDVSLHQHDSGKDDVSHDVANEPVDGFELQTARQVEHAHHERNTHGQLHGMRSANELQHFVHDDRDDGDVDDIPPRHRRPSKELGQPRHEARFRIASATRTTCTISDTRWTRTMCAPAITATVTAAAVAQSRSGPAEVETPGAAAARKDLREAPTRSGRPSAANRSSAASAE